MFAPPPVQLSRAEVAARLEAKRRNAESAGSLTRPTSSVSDRSNSLHRRDSRSPTSPKHHIFGKSGRVKVSSPLPTSPPASPRPPKKSSGVFKFVAGEEVEDSPDLPNGFGESPRRAPEPPRRGTRPPSDFFERRGPGKSFPPQTAVPTTPQLPVSPPPIPAKSPRRQLQRLRDDVDLSFAQSIPNTLPVSDASSKLLTESGEWPTQTRSLSAPAVNAPDDKHSMEQAKPRSSRIEKSAPRRTSATISIRKALEDYDGLNESAPRRATESDISKVASESQSQASAQRSRWKEEAVTKPLTTASDAQVREDRKRENENIAVPIPLPFNLMNKDLPATPTSIMATPTELYHVIPPHPTRAAVRSRKSKNKKRSPLSPIAVTNAKANSISGKREDTSPSRLSAIPELTTLSENSPVSSGISTPVETHIHLRNGSVVTVSPPEMTAWKRSYYIQGPIKLPKPVIVPRKNSMASLEAFQEVVDQVYQEALNISRRQSDDAVVDDVCEFFDDFGFDEISFEGDILAVDEIMNDEVTVESDQDSGCFSTTPPAEDPSPVEKVLAQEIVHTLARPSPVPKPPIPPVQNEETLRARGIARLAHGMASQHHAATTQHGRKDSLTMAKAEPVLPLLPLPEESMLEAVLEPSRAENDVPMVDQSADRSGFDWDDDVEELDGHTHWLAPGLFTRRRRGSKGHHRRVPSTTPIQRMKELSFL